MKMKLVEKIIHSVGFLLTVYMGGYFFGYALIYVLHKIGIIG